MYPNINWALSCEFSRSCSLQHTVVCLWSPLQVISRDHLEIQPGHISLSGSHSMAKLRFYAACEMVEPDVVRLVMGCLTCSESNSKMLIMTWNPASIDKKLSTITQFFVLYDEEIKEKRGIDTSTLTQYSGQHSN